MDRSGSDQRPVPLEYETPPPPRDPFWRRSPLLWAIICFNLWGFALIGPIFFVMGALSFFIDPPGEMTMFGEEVRTVGQKGVWVVLNLLIATLGIGFIWRERRRRQRGGPDS